MSADASPAGRLGPLTHDALDEPGRAVWDAVVGTRGAELVGDDGALVGPFNAWVHAPGVGRHLASLGAKLRFGTSIPRALSEIAIITVGARWKAEFEWWAHARMAAEHGVDAAVIEAIGDGGEPPFTDEAEAVVHRVAHQLAATGQVDDRAYGDAVALLGEAGMVELVSLCGYYSLIAFTLNAFRVPLPPGAPPRWS